MHPVNAGGSWDIHGRLVAPDGSLDGSSYPVAAGSQDERYPRIAADPVGGGMVVWQGYEGGDGAFDLHGRQLWADGKPVGASFALVENDEDQQRPCIAGDEKGGYLLTWQDDRNGNWDLYGVPLQGDLRTIEYQYDGLHRLTRASYSTEESFEYDYDAVGNRTLMTSTTPLSGTVVTGYTYDAAGRLTGREVSDGRSYTYTWSARNELLAEHTQGYPVRTFTWDAAGRMVEATVFTQTTRFTYNGDGNRLAVEVVGQETITYSLDYAAGGRILAEETITGTTLYLYPSASSGPGGRECLGEYRDSEWLYYLSDAGGYVRQGADEQGEVVSAWLFDPDGTLLEGPDGLVSHLVCGGVYDASTGLIYKNGNYFDPTLGIWLMLAPLVVVYSWRGRRKRGFSIWRCLMLLIIGVGGILTACKPAPDWETVEEDLCITRPVPPGVKPPSAPGARNSYPVIIESYEEPKVHTVSAQAGGHYYRYEFKYNFRVVRPTQQAPEGWIIQQIEYQINQSDNSRDVDDYYWEAWRVEDGKTEPVPYPDADHSKFDDGFTGSVGATAGSINSKGLVKFYEGDLPDSFIPDPRDPQDFFRISEFPPPYWESHGTVHDLKFEWEGRAGHSAKWCWEATWGDQSSNSCWP